MARVRIGNTWVTDLRKALPEHPILRYAWRELSAINGIAVHHTGVVGDMSAEAIANYHISARPSAPAGWPGIAYSFLVHPGGRVEYVGDILTTRYHVAGMNSALIGVCVAGNYLERLPWKRARESLKRLLANLCFALGQELPVKGHRDWAVPGHGTSCPGRAMEGL